MQRVMSVTSAVSSIIALSFVFFAFYSKQLDTIRISESIQVGNFITIKEELITQFWILAEEALKLWEVSITTSVYLIVIVTSLKLICYICRQKKEAENELAKMNFLIKSTQTLMYKARDIVVHTQQMEVELRAGIWKELCSAKKFMVGEGRHRAWLRNETYELKQEMKKRDKLFPRLEKSIESMKKRITAKKQLDIELQVEIYSLQRMMLPQSGKIHSVHFQNQMDSVQEPTSAEQDSAEERIPAEHASGDLIVVLAHSKSVFTQGMYKPEHEVQISKKPTIRKAVKYSIKSRRNIFSKSC
jgi:hypothetical protein